MRSKSREIMGQIMAFADRFYCEYHKAPSTSEIGEAVGISKSTAYRYLMEMNEKGMIRYDGPSGELVTSMIRKFSSGVSLCPVLGSIPCGPADTEEEHVLEYISLPVSLFGKGEYYILKAAGDSMVDAGILEDDLVVIRKDCEAKEGDIIVALTGENESTLKEYGGIDRNTGEAVLLYQNREKYPDAEIRVKSLTVQGVAKHVIKAL